MFPFPPTYPASDYINDLRIWAAYDFEYQDIEVRLLHYSGLGGRVRTVGKPIEMAAPAEGIHIPPTFRLNKESAQVLMDQLYRCGIRPTEGSGSAGSLAATEKHLADMRCIAFASLKIPQAPKAK